MVSSPASKSDDASLRSAPARCAYTELVWRRAAARLSACARTRPASSTARSLSRSPSLARPHPCADLEWRVIYVGSASGPQHDQELENVLVGPVPLGTSQFILTAPPPNARKIPDEDILGATVVLICCSYKGHEFIRVGYWVNNTFGEALPEGALERTNNCRQHQRGSAEARGGGKPVPRAYASLSALPSSYLWSARGPQFARFCARASGSMPCVKSPPLPPSTLPAQAPSCRAPCRRRRSFAASWPTGHE